MAMIKALTAEESGIGVALPRAFAYIVTDGMHKEGNYFAPNVYIYANEETKIANGGQLMTPFSMTFNTEAIMTAMNPEYDGPTYESLLLSLAAGTLLGDLYTYFMTLPTWDGWTSDEV